MSLSRQLLGSPTCGNTLVTFTLGNSNDVDDLVLLKQRSNLESLLKVRFGKFDLVGDASSVDLDLHEVGLLLRKTSLGELSVGEDSNDSAVLLDTLDFSGDGLARGLRVLLGVSGESLLL